MASPGTATRRRAPKGDKRERTRAALIQATIELVREKGFEGTTLADVAERVGMTTGAIYGNFKNRNELFFAVARQRGGPIIPNIRPGMTFAESMTAMAEAVIAALPQRREAARGALSYQAYALTHEEIRQRVVTSSGEIYRLTAEGMRAMFPESELPMPAETLVRVLHAMTDGLVFQRIMTPELVGDEVIRAAFAALVPKR